MKTKFFRTKQFVLGLLALLGASVATAAMAQPIHPARAGHTATAGQTPQAIPWNQIGARAGAGYQGDGLTVRPTAGGAQLHCVFQRLDDEATDEGLWLTSSVAVRAHDRFRVRAIAVGRASNEARTSRADGAGGIGQGVAPQADSSTLLAARGAVSVEGQTVRYSRPGLTEEYSVSLDGVRQDFVVTKKPPGNGDLQVRLEVAGAKVEAMPGGAQLVLAQSGRKIAYSRLRATDATGRELPVRMAVTPDLVIVVNDKGVMYPVRIDPTFSDANWISMGSGMNGFVGSLVVSDGTLYAGGYFTTAGGSSANYIASWNGTDWSPLGLGINSNVWALTVSGNTLYAGGQFTSAGSNAANYIAQWNGTNWSALGSGMNNSVDALVVSGGLLYAGGGFTMAGGSNANYIGQWNGSSWSALDLGMNGSVRALAVSGGTLYAGGTFTTAGGSNANNIARWNGTNWSPLGLGMNGYVDALAVSGNALYAGGGFTTAGGSNANYIAKWNGTNWSTLGSGLGSGVGVFPYVTALTVSGNTLFVAGNFKTVGGVSANFLACWNGTNWSALGSGVDYIVGALAVSSNTLYVGGGFTMAGTNASADVAEAILNPGNWLTLQAGVPGPGTNTLNYVGLPSSQYVVQYATNLTTSPWFMLATNTPGAYGVGTVQDPAATAPQRFYRLSGP